MERMVDRRERAVDRRERDLERREGALRSREDPGRTEAEVGARADREMRKVNERLVIATVEALSRIDVAEQTSAQMAYQAEHDALTNLPNRLLLEGRLEQAITLALRHGKRVALLYLDLDFFKEVNDRLGHPMGDQLLQSTARRLQASVRLSDTVCRQGGDEFVVLLPEIQEPHDAVLAARKLVAAMVRPHRIAGHRLKVTLSIGISLFPDHGRDPATLVRKADLALYRAKELGRNNFQVFSPGMER